VLASPVTVFGKALSMIADGELPTAIAVSGQRVALGFLIGALVAPRWRWSPACFATRRGSGRLHRGYVPHAALVGLDPAVHHLVRHQREPKIALIRAGRHVPHYFNIYAGIRGVDAQLVEAGRVLAAAPLGADRHVVLPGRCPARWSGCATRSARVAGAGVGRAVNASQGIGT